MPSWLSSFVPTTALLVQAVPPPARRLDTSGVLLMSLSIGSVLTLVVWCYRRILTRDASERNPPAQGS